MVAIIYVPIWVIPAACLILLCVNSYVLDLIRWIKHRRKVNNLWRD